MESQKNTVTQKICRKNRFKACTSLTYREERRSYFNFDYLLNILYFFLFMILVLKDLFNINIFSIYCFSTERSIQFYIYFINL